MIANNTKDKKRISFTHFIQVNIRYGLTAIVEKRKMDALSCGYNVEYEDEVSSSFGSAEEREIDLRWIYGDTAGEPFNRLTEMERYLLYLKYVSISPKYNSDYDIAKITGIDRMYIRRKMIKLVDQIKQMALT